MDFIINFFKGLYDLGAIVLVPLVMIILGLVFGMGIRKSLRAGLTVGIGLAGVFLILDFFLAQISDVAGLLTEKFGGSLTFIDAGWASFAAVGWSSFIGMVFIPLGIATNVIAILVGFTKNLNVNIWDYWESIVGGYMVQFVTGKVWLGLIAGLVVHVINLKVGDWTQPLMENYFGFKGIASGGAGLAESGILTKPIAWVVEKIPGINKVHVTPQTLTKRFGFFGEPMFIGFVIGALMGFLSGQAIGPSLTLGVNIAAVMYLQPKMITVLMEGLVPIAEGAKNFMDRKAPGRELFIGLDPAIGTGNATALAVTLVMIPITIVMSLVLPGNKIVPMADLTAMVFYVMWAAANCKGDVIKTFLTSLPIIIMGLYSCTYTGPILGAVAVDAGFATAGGPSLTYFGAGTQPHNAICALFAQLVSGKNVFNGFTMETGIGVAIVAIYAILTLGWWIITKKELAAAKEAKEAEIE